MGLQKNGQVPKHKEAEEAAHRDCPMHLGRDLSSETYLDNDNPTIFDHWIRPSIYN